MAFRQKNTHEGSRHGSTIRNLRRQRADQTGTGRPYRMLYGSDQSLLARAEKVHRLDFAEHNRHGGRTPGGVAESLASSVDIPVGIQFSHVVDSRGHQ